MLPTTIELDKEQLVSNIKDNFLNFDRFVFGRVLLEFFTPDGVFVGDNVVETTYSLRENEAPLIYEVSGPYDAYSNQYPTLARVFCCGKILFQCDLKPGVLQRTAAMAWLYLDVLKHQPNRVLLYGAGRLGRHIGEYLKQFVKDLDGIDYYDIKGRPKDFEDGLGKSGLETRFIPDPDLGLYDTILLATNTDKLIIDSDNIQRVRPGSVVISLCTTSQVGEISPNIYGNENINLFLDYEDTKHFTADMKKANERGSLSKAILLHDILKKPTEFRLNEQINLVRLTGTPMQNIAVIQMMMDHEGVDVRARDAN